MEFKNKNITTPPRVTDTNVIYSALLVISEYIRFASYIPNCRKSVSISEINMKDDEATGDWVLSLAGKLATRQVRYFVAWFFTTGNKLEPNRSKKV